jgi:hypothetical protein
MVELGNHSTEAMCEIFLSANAIAATGFWFLVSGLVSSSSA